MKLDPIKSEDSLTLKMKALYLAKRRWLVTSLWDVTSQKIWRFPVSRTQILGVGLAILHPLYANKHPLLRIMAPHIGSIW